MTAAEQQLAALDAADGDITRVPLTRAEEIRLAHLEEEFQEGRNLVLEGYQRAGGALGAIRDGRLYRATHGDFASYLADRWNMSSSRGYQLIEAARVSTIVEIAGLPAPGNEAQARELGKVDDPELQVEVYQKAIERTDGRPTAKTIREARDEVVPRLASKVRRRPLPDAFLTATLELGRKVGTMARLVDDDRWTINAPVLRQRYGSDVRRAAEALATVTRALGIGELVLMSAANETDFETALAEARAEDDLSADNVVTKLVNSTSVCTVCGGDLDPVIVAEGGTTHPGCEVA